MLQAGARLGDRYRLEARLGAGGMGEVWRAADEVLGRIVAVKAMLPEVAGQPEFARRFRAEARAMAGVNHPAVASIHDYGRTGEVTYLVMEFIDGESLDRVLARAGRLDPGTAMALVAQAADGLQAVHDRGIVHRDVKPANLMVRADGSLLITDFGISRTGDGTQLTATGAILGTPTYLAPEQVLGRPATAQSDVYSLGLAAYQCLSGRRPFEGDNPYAVALQRLQTPPPPLSSDLPAPARAVVDRALAIDPADRWLTAAAMAAAARAAVGAVAPVAPPRATRATRRRHWIVAGAVVAALLAAGGAAVRWGGGDGRSITGAPGPAVTAGPPAGFVTCDAALCPARPMCWSGVLATNGRATSPRLLDCGAPHRWETFIAVPLPAGLRRDAEDALLDRADIRAVCTPAASAARSRDRAATEGWEIDAWPIEGPGAGVRLAHCLARPEQGGETTGSVFATAG